PARRRDSMTAAAPTDGRNLPISRAALALHSARAMARLGYVLTAICLFAPAARAQTAMAPTCTGTLMGDPIGLAFPDNTGALQSITTTYNSFTFNKAECDCATTDLALQLQLRPSALPVGTVANNQVWVGT